jgi:TolA-binding protein
LKQIIILVGFIFLVGCNSNEKNSVIQKKLDSYFEKSSKVNLDKDIRLNYIDSANNIIQEASENDSIKIKNYFKLANRYFILLEYEKYKKTTNKILDFSKSINDSLNIAKAEYYLGDFYFFTSKNDSAYYYFLSAEKKYKNLNDKANLATTILHKAYILLYEKII